MADLSDKKYILSGGGSDIFKILSSLGEIEVFSGRSVGYVAVAAEPIPGFPAIIREGFNKIQEYIGVLGGREAVLIDSSCLHLAYGQDVLVISGGDTGYLIDTLIRLDFEEFLTHGQWKCMVGISAGAIAMSRQGLGTQNGSEKIFNGLGLVDEFVIPHSNQFLREKYPDALHLDEYQLKTVSGG